MKKLFSIIFISLLAIVTQNIFADELAPDYHGGWVNLGLGGAWGNNLSGPAGELSFNYAPSTRQLWTGRIVTTANLLGATGDVVCSIASSTPDQFQNCINGADKDADEYGLMYGLMSKGSEGYVSASAGLGLVNIITPEIRVKTIYPNGNVVETKLQDRQNQYTIGVPLEVQAFLTPFKYAGIGVIGFGDLNTKKSFGGVMLALQFGLLKS